MTFGQERGGDFGFFWLNAMYYHAPPTNALETPDRE
jgi:hypothetical protein